MSVIIKKNGSKEDIQKGIQKASTQKPKKAINMDRYFGKVNFGVDGLKYQKKIRNEWK